MWRQINNKSIFIFFHDFHLVQNLGSAQILYQMEIMKKYENFSSLTLL